MAEPARAAPRGARAVELFLDEARAAERDGRYRQALVAVEKAVRVAEELDDPTLQVRALAQEASTLRMLGDVAAALPRYTRILPMAQDPVTSGRLGGDRVAREVAKSYMDWVECAPLRTEFPARSLFGVLDAADRLLTATGHRDWRAGILLQRANVHGLLGEQDVAVAEEALAAHRPGAPGYTLSSYRGDLGYFLRLAGRYREAQPTSRRSWTMPGAVTAIVQPPTPGWPGAPWRTGTPKPVAAMPPPRCSRRSERATTRSARR